MTSPTTGFSAFQQHWGNLSRPGQCFMEVLSCPDIKIPPLGPTDVIQRNAVHYIWHQFGCRSCYGDGTIRPFGAPLLFFFLGLLESPDRVLNFICPTVYPIDGAWLVRGLGVSTRLWACTLHYMWDPLLFSLEQQGVQFQCRATTAVLVMETLCNAKGRLTYSGPFFTQARQQQNLWCYLLKIYSICCSSRISFSVPHTLIWL